MGALDPGAEFSKIPLLVGAFCIYLFPSYLGDSWAKYPYTLPAVMGLLWRDPVKSQRMLTLLSLFWVQASCFSAGWGWSHFEGGLGTFNPISFSELSDQHIYSCLRALTFLIFFFPRASSHHIYFLLRALTHCIDFSLRALINYLFPCQSFGIPHLLSCQGFNPPCLLLSQGFDLLHPLSSQGFQLTLLQMSLHTLGVGCQGGTLSFQVITTSTPSQDFKSPCLLTSQDLEPPHLHISQGLELPYLHVISH